jgi:hypothetical protein
MELLCNKLLSRKPLGYHSQAKEGAHHLYAWEKCLIRRTSILHQAAASVAAKVAVAVAVAASASVAAKVKDSDDDSDFPQPPLPIHQTPLCTLRNQQQLDRVTLSSVPHVLMNDLQVQLVTCFITM